MRCHLRQAAILDEKIKAWLSNFEEFREALHHFRPNGSLATSACTNSLTL